MSWGAIVVAGISLVGSAISSGAAKKNTDKADRLVEITESSTR